MMKRKPGCLNDLAKRRADSRTSLDHPNFEFINRGAPTVGKLVRDKAGKKTYVYGAERLHPVPGRAAAQALKV